MLILPILKYFCFGFEFIFFFTIGFIILVILGMLFPLSFTKQYQWCIAKVDLWGDKISMKMKEAYNFKNNKDK